MPFRSEGAPLRGSSPHFPRALAARLKEAAETVFPEQKPQPQRLKPHSKQCRYRSGKPLRHPKSSATPTFSAACKTVPYPKPIYETRSRKSPSFAFDSVDPEPGVCRRAVSRVQVQGFRVARQEIAVRHRDQFPRVIGRNFSLGAHTRRPFSSSRPPPKETSRRKYSPAREGTTCAAAPACY
jgi:hypothetical protein